MGSKGIKITKFTHVELWAVFLDDQVSHADYVCNENAIKSAGGVWNNQIKAYVFTFDPQVTLESTP